MYAERNMVVSEADKSLPARRLSTEEEERLQGFQTGYTMPVKGLTTNPVELERRRKSLLGNAWQISVITFILRHAIEAMQGTIAVTEL